MSNRCVHYLVAESIAALAAAGAMLTLGWPVDHWDACVLVLLGAIVGFNVSQLDRVER